MYTDRIAKSIEIAATFHESQYRKNPGEKVPFVSHVLAVGMMLAAYGYAEDVVIAGILHDIVEDTEVTLEGIEEEFGEYVASPLVKAVSESDKSLSWRERKALYLEQVAGSPEEAKAISCCGVTHNLRSILTSLEAGENMWQQLKHGKEEQLEQFRRLLAIYQDSLPKREMVEQCTTTLERIEFFAIG